MFQLYSRTEAVNNTWGLQCKIWVSCLSWKQIPLEVSVFIFSHFPESFTPAWSHPKIKLCLKNIKENCFTVFELWKDVWGKWRFFNYVLVLLQCVERISLPDWNDVNIRISERKIKAVACKSLVLTNTINWCASVLYFELEAALGLDPSSILH